MKADLIMISKKNLIKLNWPPSQSKNLQLVDVADRKPLLLQVRPGKVRNLVICFVFQERRLVLRPVATRSQVPNVGLAVVSDRAHMDSRLRCPGHCINAIFVITQSHHWNHWLSSYIEKYLESIIVTQLASISMQAKRLVLGSFLFQASFRMGLPRSVSYWTEECCRSLMSNCLTLPSAPTEAKIFLSFEKWIS